MKMSISGKGSLGSVAEYFLHACQVSAADETWPETVSCAETICLAPDAVSCLLDTASAAQYTEILKDVFVRLGTQPLRLQPSPVGEVEDFPGGLRPCAYVSNQGTPEQRVQAFAAMTRTLINNTETPPALMVMALVGVRQDNAFFPLISGTGCASNPYVWSEYIDPQLGVVRLAMGLDLPLHDQSGDDFMRVVALGAPQRRPEADFDDIAQHSQRHISFLNLKTGFIASAELTDLLRPPSSLPVELLMSRGPSVLAPLHGGVQALTFDRLLARNGFISDLQRALRILSSGFNAPAEIAFTVALDPAGAYQIHIYNAQPMLDWPLLGDLREQVRVGGILPPNRRQPGGSPSTVGRTSIIASEILFEAEGAVMGRSRRQLLDHIIYVVPEKYVQLNISARFEVARLLGRLNRSLPAGRWALLGPGRWCTTSPELGVPTTFAEISRANALVEIVEMHTNLVPDVSRGIHIFNELVATNMLYLAIFPGNPHNTLARERLTGLPNRLTELLPDAARWTEVVRVIAAPTLGGAGAIELHADSRRQRALAYVAGYNSGG